VNKTDAQTLLHAFGSLQSIISASNEQLSVCPGLGSLKAQRLIQSFNQPFKRSKLNKIQEKKFMMINSISK
jgi:DNA excision repair protein ERCC-1